MNTMGIIVITVNTSIKDTPRQWTTEEDVITALKKGTGVMNAVMASQYSVIAVKA